MYSNLVSHGRIKGVIYLIVVTFKGLSFRDYRFYTETAPSRSVEMTPYELWHGIKPKLSFIKIIGMLVICKMFTTKVRYECLCSLSQSNYWVFLQNTEDKSVCRWKTSSFLRRNFSQKVKWEDNRTLIRLLNLSYMCWVAQRQEVCRRRPQCAWIQYLKSCGHGYLSSYWTAWVG